MADKRIPSLTVNPNKSFDDYFVQDRTGNLEAKSQSYNIVLRSMVYDIHDESGNSSGTLDFTDYELIRLTIDQDFTATITNVPINSKAYIEVTKGATDTIIFSGYGLSGSASIAQNATDLKFEVININSDIYVRQIESQTQSGSLSSAAVTASSGVTITTFYWFNWTINNNLCTLSTKLQLSFDGTVTDNFTINCATFPLVMYNDDEAMSVYRTNNSHEYSCLFEGDLIRVFAESSLASSGTTLVLNTTFRIK